VAVAYQLVLKKENFKFAASHFTIFSENRAEALHGHNYQVGLRLGFTDINEDLEMKVDFASIKEKIRALCEELDEKILIPKRSKYLKITDSPHYKKHTQVEYGERFYCFPTSEISFLPLANITSEGLARYLHEKLSPLFKKDFSKMAVSVKETSGQWASFGKQIS
jgi:6-pyruvoyltetrahydropterin/6-carboxytetrahydropterin synthase